MYFQGISSAWSSVIYFLVTLFVFMTVSVYSQYTRVNPFEEIDIGYPVEPTRKELAEILLVYHDRALLYAPLFRNCNVLRLFVQKQGDLIKSAGCVDFTRSRFMLRPLHPESSYQVLMRRPGRNVSLLKTGFRTPPKVVRPPRAYWLYVAGTGPGWIDIRFPMPHPLPHCLLTYRIFHWRHTQGRDPAIEYVPQGANLWVDWTHGVMPRVKPSLPCPEWMTYDIYCAILTGHIYSFHFIGMNYSDYMVQIFTQRVIPISPYQNQIEYLRSEAYTETIRGWQACDTTVKGECKPLLHSMPFHGEITPEPKIYANWAHHGKMRSYTLLNAPDPKPMTQSWTPIYETSNKDAIETLRLIWPFFLILLLIILLIILPFLFYVFKNNAREETMKQWYGWSSADGRLNYAITMPENTPQLVKLKEHEEREQLAQGKVPPRRRTASAGAPRKSTG